MSCSGWSNVPSGIWVDEEGTVVRPPETAYPARPTFADLDLDDPAVRARLPDSAVERLRTVTPELARMRLEPEAYVAALRDWVAHGSASRYALSPQEVLERSAPRPPEQAQAAAAFALGQHLHRSGAQDRAVHWFRLSHRLAPENWTYRRQAWTFADPAQGPTEQYDGDWLSDVRRVGAEHYYAPVELEPRSGETVMPRRAPSPGRCAGAARGRCRRRHRRCLTPLAGAGRLERTAGRSG